MKNSPTLLFLKETKHVEMLAGLKLSSAKRYREY